MFKKGTSPVWIGQMGAILSGAETRLLLEKRKGEGMYGTLTECLKSGGST